MNIPPRLHVLLARESPQALIVRRGPSKKTAVIGWNRAKDSFALGQWLKGRIYPDRCDISPDGKHWIYFAMNARGQAFTAVARTPYLKAIDFYRKGTAWGGGGLFLSNQEYWLNKSMDGYVEERKESSLLVAEEYPGRPSPVNAYAMRMTRDGWECLPNRETTVWGKRINNHWDLLHSPGYSLFNSKTREEIPFPEWDWADIDRGRVICAVQGKIKRGKVNAKGLENISELYDTNPLFFEEKIAPY